MHRNISIKTTEIRRNKIYSKLSALDTIFNPSNIIDIDLNKFQYNTYDDYSSALKGLCQNYIKTGKKHNIINMLTHFDKDYSLNYNTLDMLIDSEQNITDIIQYNIRYQKISFLISLHLLELIKYNENGYVKFGVNGILYKLFISNLQGELYISIKTDNSVWYKSDVDDTFNLSVTITEKIKETESIKERKSDKEIWSIKMNPSLKVTNDLDVLVTVLSQMKDIIYNKFSGDIDLIDHTKILKVNNTKRGV